MRCTSFGPARRTTQDGSRSATADAPSQPLTPNEPAAVESALADALVKAAAAGRFDVVAQLARELEARRLAASPNVVQIARERKRE